MLAELVAPKPTPTLACLGTRATTVGRRDAKMDDGVQIEPDGDLAAQTAPDHEIDQRINCSQVKAAI